MTFVEKLLPKGGLLRYAILSTLKEKPLHGYDIIKSVEQRTGGLWRPSPGSVYPALKELSGEGYLARKEEDGKDLYSLTTKGQDELQTLELHEGKLLDAATRVGEITTGLVVGGISLLDIAFKNMSATLEKTMKAIDEKTIKEQHELLQAYRNILQKQIEVVEARMQKTSKPSQKETPTV